MVHTLTPAGCGGRRRQVLAVTLFTVASIAAAATVGALFGWLGSHLGPRDALLSAAGIVAIIAAFREAGVLRFRIPDLKRQVPERWRRTLPLPLWSSGYGAILGSGFGTYQPAATYWVLITTTTAVGRPGLGAICMGVFGLARGAMTVLPGARLLDGFAGAHRAIQPMNAAVLAALALAIVPATANAQAFPQPNGVSDPSLHLGNVAYTRWVNGQPSVEVRTLAGQRYFFPGGREPALYGTRLAYVDQNTTVRLVEWATGRQLRRIAGARKPALYHANLAFIRPGSLTNRLQVLHTGTGIVRTIARVPAATDLGRPALWRDLIAWHENDGASHRVLRKKIGARRATTIASTSRRFMVRDPSMAWGRISWVFNDMEETSIWVRNSNGRTKRVATVFGPDFIYTTMSLGYSKIMVSRWGLLTGQASIDTIPLIGI